MIGDTLYISGLGEFDDYKETLEERSAWENIILFLFILMASCIFQWRDPIGWARDTTMGVIFEYVKIKAHKFSTLTRQGAKDTKYNLAPGRGQKTRIKCSETEFKQRGQESRPDAQTCGQTGHQRMTTAMLASAPSITRQELGQHSYIYSPFACGAKCRLDLSPW